MSAIKIFIGTDQRMGVAERALENSIRAQTEEELEFTWMRAGDEGYEWGPQPVVPYTGDKKLWATGFSGFRYIVPELCNYEGRAIYLDTDMILMEDIFELWAWSLKKTQAIAGSVGNEVMVFECEMFADAWWPRDVRGCDIKDLATTLAIRKDSLPPEWNVVDGKGFGYDTKLSHLSDMRTQPWKPWPERFDYPDHPSSEAVETFWKYADDEDYQAVRGDRPGTGRSGPDAGEQRSAEHEG
jgi:hypothetical protein